MIIKLLNYLVKLNNVKLEILNLMKISIVMILKLKK
jgi:hypothetical protein